MAKAYNSTRPLAGANKTASRIQQNNGRKVSGGPIGKGAGQVNQAGPTGQGPRSARETDHPTSTRPIQNKEGGKYGITNKVDRRGGFSIKGAPSSDRDY